MKIIYISPYLEIGGTEKHILCLIEFLKTKHNIILVAPKGKMYERFKGLGIRICDFPAFSGKMIFYGPLLFVRLLRDVAKEFPPDIVHVHAAAELLPLAKIAGLRAPLIFTCHGYTHPWDYFTSSLFCNVFAEKVIVLSQAEISLLKGMGLGIGKTRLIHNCAEDMRASEEKVREIKEKYNIHEGSVTIGTVGRLDKVKGLSLLIRALSNLSQSEKVRTRLMIVGDGKERRLLQNLAESLGLGNKVSFTGFVDDVASFLMVFDIYVSTSFREAFSTAVLEAMSMGKAIVASDLDGTKEALGNTGILFRSGSADDLRDRLSILIADAPLRAELGSLAKARYLNNFKAEEMARRVEDLYRDVIYQRYS